MDLLRTYTNGGAVATPPQAHANFKERGPRGKHEATAAGWAKERIIDETHATFEVTCQRKVACGCREGERGKERLRISTIVREKRSIAVSDMRLHNGAT